MKLYLVLNTARYVDFNCEDVVGALREDIGSYVVNEVQASDWKDLIKKFCGYDPKVIDNCVFEDEREANRIALERTCEKLTVVDKKVNKHGRK